MKRSKNEFGKAYDKLSYIQRKNIREIFGDKKDWKQFINNVQYAKIDNMPMKRVLKLSSLFAQNLESDILIYLSKYQEKKNNHLKGINFVPPTNKNILSK